MNNFSQTPQFYITIPRTIPAHNVDLFTPGKRMMFREMCLEHEDAKTYLKYSVQLLKTSKVCTKRNRGPRSSTNLSLLIHM